MATDFTAIEMLEFFFGFLPFKRVEILEMFLSKKANELSDLGAYTMTWVYNYVPGHNK